MSSNSVWPELSIASLGVSEAVRAAVLTGRKGRCSLIFGNGAIRLRRAVESGIGRPSATGKRVEVGRGLSQALAVDPIIGQHALGENPRLLHRDALDEQQRVVAKLGRGLPALHRAR